MKNKEYVEINNIKDLESLVIKRRYDIKEMLESFNIKSVDNQFITYDDNWFYEILGKLTFLQNVRIGNTGKYTRGSGMCEREVEAVYVYVTIDVPDKNSRYTKEFAKKTETEYRFKMTKDRAGYEEIDVACVLQVIENLNEDDK